MKYIKKPKLLEVFRFNIDPMPNWFIEAIGANKIINGSDGIWRIWEGNFACIEGWYIMKYPDGTITQCKPDIFDQKYIVAPDCINLL